MFKHGLVIAGLLALAACSQAPVTPETVPNLAAQRLGTAADDSVNDVAIGTKLGAVYAVGTTEGSLDGSSRGGRDVFLRRYNRNGTVVWKRQLGTVNSEFADGVAADRDGSVYIVYTVFDESPPAGTGYYTGKFEKFSKNGTLIWSRTIRQDFENVMGDVATDASGNVYVASDTSDGREVYLSKYTGSGSLLWARSTSGGGLGYFPVGLKTDAQGNAYLLAVDGDDNYNVNHLLKYSSSGTLVFDKVIGSGDRVLFSSGLDVRGSTLYTTGTITTNYNSVDLPADENAFVAKFSLSGVEQWRRVFGAPSNSSAPRSDGAYDVSLDATGGVYVTGYTDGNLGGAQPGGSDAFLRKYTASGSPVWTKQIGSAGDDGGTAVVAYGSNELYLGGYAGGALLGGTYRGARDGFLRRTDGNGNRVWTDQ